MERPIDEAMYLIEHHKPNDVNNAYELGEAFCVAIETMRKYQKIQEIMAKRPKDMISSNPTLRAISEVLEDGNDK